MSPEHGLAIGLTGGIACGKSEVGHLLDRQGVPVLDTDAVAHGLMRREGACYEAVVKAFGEKILDAAGEIDRGKLGAIVFDSEAEREKLNRLVHPAVRARWKTWLNEELGEHGAAAVMIPLLFEAGQDDGWNAIICVSASEDTVIGRLAGRGLTEAEARRRIAAQWPLSEKEARSDYVIRNDGSRHDLYEEVHGVLEEILKQGEPHHG